jgi:hypothetical protein
MIGKPLSLQYFFTFDDALRRDPALVHILA